jgi:hypothetical protein
MKASTRAVVVLACFLAALPVTAQTVLLVVREQVDGQPLPPPFPVREGISATLFDAGFIVLDAPGAAPAADTTELARLARSAGAAAVLEIAAEYKDTQLGTDIVRISAHASYAVIDSASNGIMAQGTSDATNRDRELGVNRAALGNEIGKDVVVKVKKVLDRL